MTLSLLFSRSLRFAPFAVMADPIDQNVNSKLESASRLQEKCRALGALQSDRMLFVGKFDTTNCVSAKLFNSRRIDFSQETN